MRGRRLSDNLEVAIKLFKSTYCDNATIEEAAKHLDEGKIAKLLNHPNIIKCFEISQNQRREIALIFELASYSLETEIATEPFDLGRTRDIMAMLVNGLIQIHQQCIIHRDLKPANILVNKSNKQIKISDFGLACKIDWGETFKGRSGTLYYNAPEALKNIGYDQKADIWALGCILAEIKLKKKIIDGKDSTDQLQCITTVMQGDLEKMFQSPEIVRYLKKLMAFDPKVRISALELLNQSF